MARTVLWLAAIPALVLLALHMMVVFASLHEVSDISDAYREVCFDAVSAANTRVAGFFEGVEAVVGTYPNDANLQPMPPPDTEPCSLLAHSPLWAVALHRYANASFVEGCVRSTVEPHKMYSRRTIWQGPAMLLQECAVYPFDPSPMSIVDLGNAVECITLPGAVGRLDVADVQTGVSDPPDPERGAWLRATSVLSEEGHPFSEPTAPPSEHFGFVRQNTTPHGRDVWLAVTAKASLDHQVFSKLPFGIVLPSSLSTQERFPQDPALLRDTDDTRCTTTFGGRFPLSGMEIVVFSGGGQSEQQQASMLVAVMSIALFLPGLVWLLHVVCTVRSELRRVQNVLQGALDRRDDYEVTLHLNVDFADYPCLRSSECEWITTGCRLMAGRLNCFRPFIPEALTLSLREPSSPHENEDARLRPGHSTVLRHRDTGVLERAISVHHQARQDIQEKELPQTRLVIMSPTQDEMIMSAEPEVLPHVPQSVPHKPSSSVALKSAGSFDGKAASLLSRSGNSSLNTFSHDRGENSLRDDKEISLNSSKSLTADRSFRKNSNDTLSRRSSMASVSSCLRVKMQTSKGGTISSLKVKKATVLFIEADLLRSHTVFVDQHTSLSTYFVRAVFDVSKHFEGVVLGLGPSSALVTWNCHKTIPQHCLQACQAALDLSAQLDSIFKDQHFDWSCGLASGNAFVAQTGNHAELRTAMVMGEPVHLARKLARLALRVGARILANESVFDIVQTQMYMRIVDSIALPHETVRRIIGQSDDFDGDLFNSSEEGSECGEELETTLVYELVSARHAQHIEASPEMYVEGFSYLRSHLFPEAAAKFRSYLEVNTSNYQAYRLLKITSLFAGQGALCEAPKPYYRRDLEFEEFEDKSMLVQCPKSVRVIPPPYKLLRPTEARNHTNSANVGKSIRNNDWGKDTAQLKRSVQEARAGTRVVQAAQRLALGRMCDSSDPGSPSNVTRHESLGSSLASFTLHKRGSLRYSDHAAYAESKYHTVGLVDEEVVPGMPPVEVKDKKGDRWWRSGKCLGKGAFGEVWLAMAQDGGLVAIKTMMLPEVNAHHRMKNAAEMAVGDMITEVGMLSRLRHTNIVSYLSSAVCDKHLIILMEYMSGGSLASLLEQFRTLPLSSTVRYLKDILRGLKFLHSQGIVHRDVKPHNVLLLIDGQCKLADFGASQHLMRVSGRADVVGTPLYMAPEACRGFAQKASDIWGVGILAVKLLTGEVPYTFTEENPYDPQTFIKRLAHDATFVPALPKMSAYAESFLKQCLCHEPEERGDPETLLMSTLLNVGVTQLQEIP